jgi:hypothetical protein
VMSRSSAALAAEYFPGVPVTRELGEHETLLGIDKARRLLGYDPGHTWRNHVPGSPGAGVSTPGGSRMLDT